MSRDQSPAAKPPAEPAGAPRATASATASAAASSAAKGQTPGASGAEAALSRLVRVEAALRQLRSFAELTYFAANELRGVTRAQQIFVVSFSAAGAGRVEAVSSQTFVDRAAPLVVAVERHLATIGRKHGLAAIRELDVGAAAAECDEALRAYPLPHLLWVPVPALDGALLGGLLLARAVPWTEGDVTLASHVSGALSFAWMAIAPRRRGHRFALASTRKGRMVAAAALAAVSLFPVSMSALAPVEVAPRGAFVVTAGVDGVVQQVDVEPNAAVARNQPLVRIADTVLKNRHEIAEREVVVAEAQQKKAAQLAFVDMRGRHELALAQSELDLKIAERNFAREMLDRATIRADRDGIAFFADKKDLIGRPVAVGEKLMEIVDPAATEFRIDLPAADAIVLRDGARVKVFLDSDPLRPIEAVLSRQSYKTRVTENQQLAFRLVADVAPGEPRTLRLGVRGTAQVYSDRTPLVFYLLRRPLSAARQMFGL